MPNPWGQPRYHTVFSTECRMGSSDYQELLAKVVNSDANDSDSTFSSDFPLTEGSEKVFWITSGGWVRLRIDEEAHTVFRVSDLPGVDRVLRPSEGERLSGVQRGLYHKFTQFLMSNKILFTGTFRCASHVNGANNNNKDAEIEGDRPVPVYIEHLDPMLRLDRVLSFGMGRSRGRRLMHCTPSGHHHPNEYEHERVIYLGDGSRERTDDAVIHEDQELHERLCTQIREFSTQLVPLSPLVTCGTERIQACYYSVCNCFYCRNHSPISWSLEVICMDFAGRKRWRRIESLSFYDGGMHGLRLDAPTDGSDLLILAGRLFVDHNGRLERWAVKQSRIGDLERIAIRFGLDDRDKLLFTVVNKPLWVKEPSKCYLGGDSIYDPDHYAPFAAEVMGVTFWYTPSGSWVTVGHILLLNEGLYHVQKASNEFNIVEAGNIRPDFKVVGKLKVDVEVRTTSLDVVSNS